MWCGINGIGEDRWVENGWDDTSANQPGQPGGVERTNEAYQSCAYSLPFSIT